VNPGRATFLEFGGQLSYIAMLFTNSAGERVHLGDAKEILALMLPQLGRI